MINSRKLSTHTSLSPLDGRYALQVADVAPMFCDFQLNLMRLTIEIEWLKTLAKNSKIKELKPLKRNELKFLDNIISQFTLKDQAHLKKLEQQTKHDIKALEYFLKEKLKANKALNHYQEFIHLGCTSDDINNLSYALMLASARDKLLLPWMKQLICQLGALAQKYAATPMLAHTHGQPATPTTFGKEMANFTYRLTRQFDYLFITPILGKFNGAVGNFNALLVAYPDIDWQQLSQQFVEKLNLTWNPYTTQIEPHDWLAEYCNILARFNTILIGLCRDIWGYIAIGYLTQQSKMQEVGSSTMPHKINPIDFENAEGNLGLANALFEHFATKLPISRWQRDLSDSTVMRNLGVAIGHSVLAYKALNKGLSKLEVNESQLKKELNDHWEVLAEALQTVMRRYNLKAPYEQLKALTRGQRVDKQILHKFINQLDIPLITKQNLLKLTPAKYTGAAAKLAKEIRLITKAI